MPWLARLEAEIVERDQEADDVRARGARAVDVEGSRAKQIVEDTRDRAVLKQDLARLVEVDLPVLDHYLRALRRAKRVRIVVVRDGSIVRKYVRAR